MNLKPCHHVRVRDTNSYDLNIEQYIQFLEHRYNVDFRSIPQWRELTKRLHVMTTDYKRKIQDANLRKTLIIQKLYTQFRPSPFELSEHMARTAKKWEALQTKEKDNCIAKNTIEPTLPKSGIISIEDLDKTAHRNTEIISPHVKTARKKKTRQQSLSDLDFGDLLLLPKICNNKHRRVPSSDSLSQCSVLSYGYNREFGPTSELEKWQMSSLHTSSVISTPKEITLIFDNLKEQTIKFSVTNCTGDFMHIRFKYVTDTKQFERVRVLPVTPQKLYPGIAVIYKLVFVLKERKKEFKSELLFTVGKDVYDNSPTEAFRIPIVSKFIKARNVSISEVVTIPPLYVWHMKNDPEGQFPSGTVEISVNDDRYYHLHIVRRGVDFLKYSNSLQELMQEIKDEKNEYQSEVLSSLKMKFPDVNPRDEYAIDGPKMEKSLSKKVITSKSSSKLSKIDKRAGKKKESVDVELESSEININHGPTFSFIELQLAMALIARDIVEHALDTFIFENTYLFLKPDTRKKITVFFTKIEKIGCHNCYYDFELYDPETEDLIMTKTTRIFAEILPHPIQINPDLLLDMSNSHVIYGFCEDRFIITNTHKLHPVTIKIKLSTRMSKLFSITPMETLVPATTGVSFEVKFCSRDRNKKSDDLVHVVFKIIVIGHKSIYDKVPPFYFEIIAPCVNEYRKIFDKNYNKKSLALGEFTKVEMKKVYYE